jgi:beta-lactamase regulating signal transducer with metallopeptidase domain
MSVLTGLEPVEFAVGLLARSFLLIAAVLTATWFMRRFSAAQRHQVLALAAVALLALPVLSIVVPPWSLGLFPSPLTSVSPAGAEALTHRDTAATAEPPAGEAGIADEMIDRSAGAVDSTALPRWLRWLAGVWAAGAALLLLYFVASRLLSWWVARRAPPVEQAQVLAAARTVAGRLGIDGPVSLSVSNLFKVPFVSGVLSPRLIVPPEMTSWPKDRLDAILHHELAHVRRRDVGVQFLAQLACCLYWINPLAWVLERRLFIERERACDDIALRQNVDAADYAGHLMEVMEEMGNQRNVMWVTAAMAEGTDFKDRILSVLDPGARRGSPRMLYTALVIAFTLVLLLPLAAVSPWFDTTAHGADASSMTASYPQVASTDQEAFPAEEPASTPHEGSTREAEESSTTRELIEALKSSSADLRRHAADALARFGDSDAVPALIEALDDEDPKVREHAASALGKLGDRRAIPPLSRVLLGDASAKVREHAAEALGALGKAEAIEALAKALDTDRDARVREHAAYALGMIGDPRAIGPLSKALRDPSDRVRSHAAEALSMIEPPEPAAPTQE